MSSTVTSGITTVVSVPVQFVGADIQVGSSTGTVGFYGATPVAQQTVAAVASDPATTQALANSLRTILLNLGLVKA